MAGTSDGGPAAPKPEDGAPKRRRGRPKGSGSAGAKGAGAATEGAAAATDGPTTTIKKYANRRLYDTAASRYVTLEDLAAMVREGRHFTVVDARDGTDITRSVLGQIIFEQEAKGDGPSLLPTEFLRQVISYYGDQMGAVVPSYLEASMQAFAKGQEDMRDELARLMGGQAPDASRMVSAGMEAGMAPLRMIEEQTRRNAEAFASAMAAFSPFGAASRPRDERAHPQRETPSEARTPPPAAPQRDDELNDLRRQIAAMQRKVDELGD